MKQMVDRVGSCFPKGGHSAIQTELKYEEEKLGETSPNLWHQKSATENNIRTKASNKLPGEHKLVLRIQNPLTRK